MFDSNAARPRSRRELFVVSTATQGDDGSARLGGVENGLETERISHIRSCFVTDDESLVGTATISRSLTTIRQEQCFLAGEVCCRGL